MNAVLEKTIYQLTQVNNLSEVSVDELLQLVNEHPYFAPAQLVLAAKYKQDREEYSIRQLQKTALYFSNPCWLEYHMFNGEIEEVDVALQALPVITEQKPPVPVNREESAKLVPEPEPAPVATLGAVPVPTPEPAPVAAPAPIQDPEPVVVEDHYIPVVPMPITPVIAIPTVEAVRGMMQGLNRKEREENKPAELVAVPPIPEAPAEPGQTVASVTPLEVYHTEGAAGKEEEAQHHEEATSDQVSNISSAFSEQLAEFKKKFSQPVVKEEKLDFEMEPYYTIDYFASQGIKADLSQLPQDRLTRQLLTFTDWLKKMKAVTPDPQDLGTDPELENTIQGIAQTSNEAREIATETMAEVFVKQGKIDKAVQLYIKLSFLDPKKSAYFASKIQQLKGM